MIEIVDAAVRSRALVLGTPPPEGRDLDILVREADNDDVIAALRDAGFVALGMRWARFRNCTVDLVDVETAESWGLPSEEVRALFDDAVPLGGTRHLARPDAAATVLIEARRFARGGIVTPKRAARVQAALATDESVRSNVTSRLRAWRAGDVLPIVAGESTAAADTMRKVQRRATRGTGVVVTVSGVDGSGKSSQAAALQATLERLGYDAVSVWTRITINPSINAVGDPIKRMVKRLKGGRPPEAGPAGGPTASTASTSSPDVDPVRAFRQNHPLVNNLWITYVALVNALAVRRATTAHLLRGRVVVCDRYALDSAAHLRYKYGPEERYRFQARLIRALTPKPLRSYFLDVPGTTALARKNEKYTPEQMDRLVSLYRDEHGWLDVVRLDGERPQDDLCAQIASEVAAALSDRGGQRRGRTRRSRR